MRKKRFLAVVLAASMTMANVVTAAAAAAPTPTQAPDSINQGSHTVTGTGEIGGIVNQNVFRVVVPATVSEDSVFDYIMDPQQLIKETKAAKYASGNNATVDGQVISVNSQNGYTDSSLYFVNLGSHSPSSNNRNLSDTSDPYTLINKSTMDVDVSVNAVLQAPTGVTVSTDKTFAGNKQEPSMYMAVKKKGDNTEKAISTGNAADYLLTATIPNAKTYYQKVSSNGGYIYEIPSANESSNNYSKQTYEFQLTGKCNTDADWSAVNPSGITNVKVTYYVTPHVAKPASIAQSSYSITQGQALNMDVNLGDMGATKITGITYTNDSGASSTLATSNYSFSNGVLTFTANYINDLFTYMTGSSRVYTITFDSKETVTFTLTK